MDPEMLTTETPEAVEAEPRDREEPEEQEEPKVAPTSDRVPIPQPKKPSRRDAEIAEMRKRLSESVTRKDLEEALRRQFTEMESRRPKSEPQRKTESADDEDDLPASVRLELDKIDEKREQLLRDGNLREWARLGHKQSAMIAKAHAPRNTGPNVDPMILALQMEYHDVVSHPIGPQQAKIAEYEILQENPGLQHPMLARKAFERARERLAGKKTPAPTKGEKRAYSGSPPPATGGTGKSLRLPKGMTYADVEKLAKRAGMTPGRYAQIWAEKHPEDIAEE